MERENTEMQELSDVFILMEQKRSQEREIRDLIEHEKMFFIEREGGRQLIWPRICRRERDFLEDRTIFTIPVRFRFRPGGRSPSEEKEACREHWRRVQKLKDSIQNPIFPCFPDEDMSTEDALRILRERAKVLGKPYRLLREFPVDSDSEDLESN